MRRHPTDSVSLFFGLAFVGIAVAYLGFELTGSEPPDVRWFLAFGLVLLGLLGVFNALRPRRAGPVAEPADEVGSVTDGPDADAAPSPPVDTDLDLVTGSEPTTPNSGNQQA
jgi:hypothetical protein